MKIKSAFNLVPRLSRILIYDGILCFLQCYFEGCVHLSLGGHTTMHLTKPLFPDMDAVLVLIFFFLSFFFFFFLLLVMMSGCSQVL